MNVSVHLDLAYKLQVELLVLNTDESPHWCGNVALDKWPCDNREASIVRALIFNDCTVGSNAVLHQAECISR
ncbi:putative lipid kinase YegS-like [Dirofilaria immitis]